MPSQQKTTEVDVHGEDYSKARMKQDKRHHTAEKKDKKKDKKNAGKKELESAARLADANLDGATQCYDKEAAGYPQFTTSYCYGERQNHAYLGAAHRFLNRAEPVTTKLALNAPTYGNQAEWNYLTSNAAASYDQRNGYSARSQQFATGNISAGNGYEQTDQYQFEDNNAGNSYHQSDVNTNYLVEIIDGQASNEGDSRL